MTSAGPGAQFGYPQQPGPYGTPQPGPYGAPQPQQPGHYGAPPQQPAPYGAPQPYQPAPYGAPQPYSQQPYGQPNPAPYGAPPQPNHAAPQPPSPVGPEESPAVQAYRAAVAQHMAMGGLQVSQNWLGPVWSTIGIGAVIKSSLNPIELAVCVGYAGEISPATVAGFTRQVDEFARSIRRPSAFAVKGGACAVAALISERVHPAAIPAVTNKPMSFGTVVVPAVIDLTARHLLIAQNTPMIGMAMWGSVKGKARLYLPEPRAVLG